MVQRKWPLDPTGSRAESLLKIIASLTAFPSTFIAVLSSTTSFTVLPVRSKTPAFSAMVPAGKALHEFLVYDEATEIERKRVRAERIAQRKLEA